MTAQPIDFDHEFEDHNIIPGVKISRIIRRIGEVDTFEIHFAETGRVRILSADQLMSFRQAKVAIFSGSDVVLHSRKPDEWDPIVKAIVEAAELVELLPRVEETKDWLRDYLDESGTYQHGLRKVNRDDQTALYQALLNIGDTMQCNWLYVKAITFTNGTVAFSLLNFSSWLKNWAHVTVTRSNTLQRLSEAGFAKDDFDASCRVKDDGPVHRIQKRLWVGPLP